MEIKNARERRAYGPFVLNVAYHQVEGNMVFRPEDAWDSAKLSSVTTGQMRTVQPKDVEVLRFLMLFGGKPVSRSAVRDLVRFNPFVPASEEILKAVLFRIRNLLEEIHPEGNRLLQTIKGGSAKGVGVDGGSGLLILHPSIDSVTASPATACLLARVA